jgi:hypothetical protein
MLHDPLAGFAKRIFRHEFGLITPGAIPFVVHETVGAIQVAPTGDFKDVGIDIGIAHTPWI